MEQETVRNVIHRQFSLTTNVRDLIMLLVSDFGDPCVSQRPVLSVFLVGYVFLLACPSHHHGCH